MIDEHLVGWDLTGIDLLFIENVGNLVCPTDFDLGEGARVVLLSVTEGEDKPVKYPHIFHSANLAVITKIDLAAACEFDRDRAIANIHVVHPGLEIIETSSRLPVTVDALVDHLLTLRARLHPTPSIDAVTIT
jgi:hydrogenase nickel incorporation protein HypB